MSPPKVRLREKLSVVFEESVLEKRVDCLIGVLVTLDQEERVEFCNLLVGFVNAVEVSLQQVAAGMRDIAEKLGSSSYDFGVMCAALRADSRSFDEAGKTMKESFLNLCKEPPKT